MSEPARPRSRAAPLLSVLVLLAYSAIAWAAGSFYPFSVFPMYAGSTDDTRAGRVAVRTSDGAIVEVTEFAAFECEGTLDPDRFDEACPGPHVYSPRYLDDELTGHVGGVGADVTAGETVELVRRIWTLAPDGLATSECVLARCAASR